ncbi:MAG: YfhO family protein, partial [Oscillospiraceae bacterium]
FGSEQTKWRSAAAYLPMFSVAGVVAYLRSADKKNWIRLLITVCGIFALVPVLNSAFTLFNGEYYARWYYMAILILCLATVKALEEKSDWRTGCIVGMAGTLFMAAVYLFLPLKLEHSSGSTEYTTRLAHGWLRWEELLLIGAALVFCVLLIYLIRSRRKLSYEKFLENALSFTVIAAIVTGGIQFFLARLDGPVFNSYNKAVESNVTLPEGEFYRINTEEPMNYNMNWGYGSAQSFHSIIPQAVLDLHSAIGSDDAEVIVFRPSSDLAFDALTRTKYIAKAVTFEIAEPDEFYDREHFYHFVGKQGSFNIYETEQIVPMGCSYDSFCSVKDVTDIAEECDSAANLMLHSVALDEAAAEKYSDILTREVLSAEQLDAGQMKADIADRQSLAAQDFEITKQGFTARTDFPTDRIVVFSVAYAEGWSAEANGVPLEVDRANVGFLAVRVPAGEQELVFTYKAPALDLGIAMTTAGAAALAAYLIVIYAVLKKRPTKFFPPRQESGVSLHRSYITQQTQNNGDNEKHV